ncbi:TPA_asm: P6 [Rose alphacytorhabdovirus 1]|nr:TPA_asm: P6 [Rose alphacytorhabdovirus 1]
MDFISDSFNNDDGESTSISFDIPGVGETRLSTLIYLFLMIKAMLIIVVYSFRKNRRGKRSTVSVKWA